MSRLRNESLLQRAATGEELLENNEPQRVDEVRRLEDGDNHASQMPRLSFLDALLRALAAWNV